MKKITQIVLVLLLTISSSALFAQEDEQNEQGGAEFGVNLGKLFPNDIDGVTEILPMWGLVFSHKWSRYNLEYSFVGGGEGDISYGNLGLGLRVDLPVEELVGFVTLGLDGSYLKVGGSNKQFIGGGHLGGGVFSQIDPDIWFRMDMKFTIQPGTSMYLGLGIMIR